MYRVRRAVEEGYGKMNVYLEFHVIYGQKLLSVQEILKEEEDNCICTSRPRLGLKAHASGNDMCSARDLVFPLALHQVWTLDDH